MTQTARPDADPPVSKAWYVVLALLLFAALAATPAILTVLHLRSSGAPASSHGVRLLPAPAAPPRVPLPEVALPIDPGQPPARLPDVTAARQAAAVAAEDSRIRLLVHDAASVYQPEVIPVQGALPTLVLTAGSGAYTYRSLVQYGALVMLPHHAGLLLDNVFVSTNARLDLGGPNLRALYMDSSARGFTSIVGWGGDLYFEGTPQRPLTIMGWDRLTSSPAPDAGTGRSYIRDVGGRMVLTDVRASALGFWSGRTGGVAWTGSTGQPSTGGATASTFTDETYGGFVTRGQGVRFDDDLFEFNELDGLHIHRNSTGTLVLHSSAVRNGGNGFLVDRATNGTILNGNVAEHNAGDGFLVDGRPLVTGASASGGSVAADTGTYLEDSEAIGNLQSGIVLEGGSGTVLRGDEICARLAGIAIRDGASGTIVTGNDVRCNPRVALEIGPAAPQSLISGNTLVDARIGMLVRSSGPVEAYGNKIIGATVFGITARGFSSHVSGQGNVISGTGFRAVDARADAAAPALSGTRVSGWAHQAHLTVWSYLEYHPLALLWLSIVALVLGGEIWSRLRRMPPHPYPASTHWRGPETQPGAAGLALALSAPAGGRGRFTAGAGEPVPAAGPVRVKEPVPAAGPVLAGEAVPGKEPVWAGEAVPGKEPARAGGPVRAGERVWAGDPVPAREPARFTDPPPFTEPVPGRRPAAAMADDAVPSRKPAPAGERVPSREPAPAGEAVTVASGPVPEAREPAAGGGGSLGGGGRSAAGGGGSPGGGGRPTAAFGEFVPDRSKLPGLDLPGIPGPPLRPPGAHRSADPAPRGWFTPPVPDTPEPGPDREAQPRHWVPWAVTPPPAPAADDLAEAGDTRPFPKVEGLA